jgi:hypothetical protein
MCQTGDSAACSANCFGGGGSGGGAGGNPPTPAECSAPLCNGCGDCFSQCVCDGTGDAETCDNICSSGDPGTGTSSDVCEYPECGCDSCLDTCLCQGIDQGTCSSLCFKGDAPGPTVQDPGSDDPSQQGSCAASVVGASRATTTRTGSALALLIALGLFRAARRRR